MQKADRDAVIQIILWNLAPYWGVLFLGWQPLSIPICYVLESLVIGGFNVFKLIPVVFSGKQEEDPQGINTTGVLAIPMFISSYSLALTMQFYGLFHALDLKDGKLVNPGPSLGLLISNNDLMLLMTGFVVLNAYSFVTDFILTQRYTQLTIGEQFQEPFVRVFITHFLIAIGGMVYVYFHTGLGVLIVLSTIKIWVELRLRNKKLDELLKVAGA